MLVYALYVHENLKFLGHTYPRTSFQFTFVLVLFNESFSEKAIGVLQVNKFITFCFQAINYFFAPSTYFLSYLNDLLFVI